jgi:hypothetical protein
MGEPLTRFLIVASYREATRALWGDTGVERFAAALPEDTRELLRAQMPPETWVAVRHSIVLADVAWETLCTRDRTAFHTMIDRVIDFGFGRRQRLLLSLANPPMLLRRAADLWREDHTEGTLGYVPLAVDAARITLRDHPYAESPVQRDAFAEGLRHAMSLSHVRSVTAEELPSPPHTLHVILRWT